LAGAKSRVEGSLEKAHIVVQARRENFFRMFLQALAVCRELEHAGAGLAKRLICGSAGVKGGEKG